MLRVSRLLVLVLVGIACGGEPAVRWQGERTAFTTGADVTLDVEGRLVPDAMMALAGRVSVPGASCPRSLRLAAAGRVLYGVWWAQQPDSSARLLSAHSLDGGAHWSAPSPIDTTDRSAAGCTRVAPAIAADSATNYVHVTYALLAAEGPGLFFSHSMDGGASFHAPVPILYGERLGRTSVAADGDVVVVGFEDPNGTQPRIGLALSRTMGHIFEQRLLPLSDDHGAASHPYTAVSGRRVAVAWERRAEPSAGPVVVLRTGTLP
ncbi:MAG: hypothetical protein H0W68_11415 [Gemmatimonadaceae bacterium]|nr:hypothetical protein [Gemmatimonadaceae bacterium]